MKMYYNIFRYKKDDFGKPIGLTFEYVDEPYEDINEAEKIARDMEKENTKYLYGVESITVYD